MKSNLTKRTEELKLLVSDSEEAAQKRKIAWRYLYYFLSFWLRFNIIYTGFINFDLADGMVFKVTSLLDIKRIVGMLDASGILMIYITIIFVCAIALVILLYHLQMLKVSSFMKVVSKECEANYVYIICKASPMISKLVLVLFLRKIDVTCSLPSTFACIPYLDYSLSLILLTALISGITTYIVLKVRHILYSREFNPIKQTIERYLVDISVISLGIFNRFLFHQVVPKEYKCFAIGAMAVILLAVYFRIKVGGQVSNLLMQKEMLNHSFFITSFQIVFWVTAADPYGNVEINSSSSKHYFMGMFLFSLILKLHFNFLNIDKCSETIRSIFRKGKTSKKDVMLAMESLVSLLTQLNCSPKNDCYQILSFKLWESILDDHKSKCQNQHCYCTEKRNESREEELCRKSIRIVDELLFKTFMVVENRRVMLTQYLLFLFDILGNYLYAVDLLNNNKFRDNVKLGNLETHAFRAHRPNESLYNLEEFQKNIL